MPCAAQDPRIALSLPVDCEIGKTCTVQNYFDHDPGPGAKDYNCGLLAYDGHEGTDIRLPNLAAMAQGYRVLAAADGRVRAIRDGTEDVSLRDVGKAAVKDREAGNSVVIDHGGGWETQYAHLRKGSVVVKPGQEVKRGQPLGLIGLSGFTEFPHLHLAVRYRGRNIDPFIGSPEHDRCGLGAKQLWDAKTLTALRYTPSGLLNAGFAGDAVTFEAVRSGQLPAPAATAPALLFWIDIYGAQAGDEEHFRIVAPDGRIFVERRDKVPGNKAEWFSFVGKKREGAPWPAGTYRAEYALTRGSPGGAQTVLTVTREVQVSP